MNTAQGGVTAGQGGPNDTPPPGRRLTPAELHAKRKAWGREWGDAMKAIKRQHKRKGI